MENKKVIEKLKAAQKKQLKLPAARRKKTIEIDGDFYYIMSGEKVTHKGALAILNSKKTKRHTEFKKGQSGNPAGRPHGAKGRKNVLENILALTLKDKLNKPQKNPFNRDQKEMTVEEAIMASLIKKALQGDVPAIREIQDTMYGKIKDVTEIIQPVGLEITDDMTTKEAADLYQEVIGGEVVKDNEEEDED